MLLWRPRETGSSPRRGVGAGRHGDVTTEGTTPWGGTYTMCHLSLTWTSDRATSKGEQMGEANWQQARLIPTSGINGSDEAERRATSGLLAVMRAVREFGLAVVKPLGAPAAQLECFIEVPFAMGDETCRPDGLIQLTR